MASKQALEAFAEILDYPEPGLSARVETSIAELAPFHPGAARRLEEFRSSLRRLGPGELQEAYVAAFDFQPECSPHVGWHLFGDDPRRGVFLAGLAERYRARGFPAGKELPDHLGVMLRFLAGGGEPEIVQDALLPALASLARGLEKRHHPYAAAVHALVEVLEG